MPRINFYVSDKDIKNIIDPIKSTLKWGDSFSAIVVECLERYAKEHNIIPKIKK